MSYNRKALKTATNELGKAKAPAKPKDIITDPMGQWKYPGENTRIPGSDITMQGVDYPVWAQPNIGQPQMMYPGQEYQFPGADYVDEFPQGGNEEYYEDDLDEEQIAELRAGGYVVEDISVPQLTKAQKGITISDPKEYAYRKQMYDDSTNLYNAYKMQDKLMGPGSYKTKDKYKWNTAELKEGRKKKMMPGLTYPVAVDYQNEADQFKNGYNEWTARKQDKKLLNYYKKLGFKPNQIMYHSSPDIVSDKIKAVGSYFDGDAVSPIYKKPVQAIYKPGEEPTSDVESTDKESTNKESISLKIKPLQKINIESNLQNEVIPLTYSKPKKYNPTKIAYRSQTIMEPDPDREGKYRMKELRQVPYATTKMYRQGDVWEDEYAPRVMYTDAEGNETEERPNLKKGGSLKKYSRSLEATNKLFRESPLLKKAKSKKKKIFDPSSNYYQDGGSNTTKLTNKEEEAFQKFYPTLPDNLMQDDPEYDIRGYWDSEGRPETFDYNQPKQEDGYHHAYSINSKTGEYLKSPTHPTFQHAIDEDRKMGYRPVTNVQGRNIATENPLIVNEEQRSFLTNTEGPVSFQKVGGIPNLPLREGRKAYERLGYTDNDRMAVAAEGGFLPQAQAGKATTSLILNPYEQGMFNTNVHAQGSNKPSFGFGVQRSNMFPRWAKENDVKTSMSGQVQIPYAMDRGPAIKGTARTAYSPNAGRGNLLDFTTQAQLEAGYSPNYGFNANVMAWPYAHGSNVPEARWKENKYYPGAVRAGAGPQAGFSYASDNKTFNGDDYMNPNRAGVHYGGKGFVEYTPTDWLKLKLEAQGMFDPIANKRDENAEIEGTKWKFSPGVNVSATVPLNFNKAKVKPNLQRKAQLYNDEIDGNFVKQASINSGPMRKNGGNINNDYIEVDADDNDIANYIAQGYEVEELPQAQYAGQTPFVHPDAGATQVLFQKPAPVKPNSKYDPKAPVNYQAKLKPVVADNTRDVTADEALAAIQNAAYMASPEYKAKQKAEKEAQAKFEKEQWANYNKMSLGEKVLDRTNAALNQPLVMASNLLMGEQAYIPGMAEGLGEDNINYDEYLKATGQSRGLSVNDVFNVVNPGNWGGHAGREYGKGNYVQGATELGLGLLGLKGAPMGEEIAKRYADKLINLEKKLGTETGLLSNTRKINPWAENLNDPLKSYRVAGMDAAKDFENSGVLRSVAPKIKANFAEGILPARTTSFPSFQKGYADLSYANPNGSVVFETNLPTFKRGDINPVTGQQIKGRHYAHRVIDPKTGATMTEIPGSEIRMFGDKPHWLKGYQEVPNLSATNAPVKSGIGGMDMSRYEIKNPDYFTQLLDTYDSKALSSTNKKFYKDLIGSVKKQNGLVTERQYNELQRLKTGNFNFGKKGYKEGGSLELDLTPDEIQAYIDAGYTIEDID